MKAVILARISSKEQRDGHSLEAQTRNLENYAEGKGFEVIKTFTLIESSTKKQRPEFDAMISFIKRQKSKIALIVDTVDRLQRSFRETPIFNDLMQQDIVELHFIKEGNVLSKDATSTQKLMWNMGVVMAQSYTDQLSDNVKRSMKHKVRNGEWCGLAPLGYINVTDKKTGRASVEPDSNNADLIKRVFIEYGTGEYSLTELARQAKEWGLRSRKGNAVGVQLLLTMIQNPFYYGVMQVKGELHPHKYEQLITKEVFDQCQLVRTGRSQKRGAKTNQHQFLFSGLIKCDVSDRQVTCDLKKGKYVYLICRDPDNHNKKLWIREAYVIQQIEIAIESIHLPADQYEQIIDHIHKITVSEQLSNRDSKSLIRKQLYDTETQIDRLTDLLVNNHITEDAYQRKHSHLQLRHSELTAHLANPSIDPKQIEKALITMVSLCNRASLVIKSSKMLLKRSLVETLFSNLSLNGRNLRWNWVSPLSIVAKNTEYNKWLRTTNIIRTGSILLD